jgi:hypothetical protein
MVARRASAMPAMSVSRRSAFRPRAWRFSRDGGSGTCGGAVAKPQSAIDNHNRQSQSAIGNRQSAIGNRQSAISNRQSAIGNQQSAIGNQQSAMQSAINDRQSAMS